MMPFAKPLHILIVDDHALLADTLEIFLARLGEEIRISKATTVPQALAIANGANDIDLALFDLHIPDMDGIAGLRYLRKKYPNLPVAMMSGDVDRAVVQQAKSNGARAFISKSIGGPGIVDAIRRILAGEVFVDAAPEAARSQAEADPHQEALASLSPREKDVLAQLTEGRSNKEIARELGISVVTVTLHLSSIYRKLGVQGRTQAVRFALGLKSK